MMRFSDLHYRKISPCSSVTSCCSHRRSQSSTKFRSVLGCILCSSCCNSKMTNSDVISDHTTEATATRTQVRSGKSLCSDVFLAARPEASTAISECQPEERSSLLYHHDIVTDVLPTSATSMEKRKEPRTGSILFATEGEMEATGKNKASVTDVEEEIVKGAVEMVEKGREERAENNKKTNKKKKLAKKKKKIMKKKKEAKVEENLKQMKAKKEENANYSAIITERKDHLEKLEQELKILSDAIEKKREKIKEMKADNKSSESLVLMLTRNLYIARSLWREKILYMKLVKLRFQRERSSKSIQEYRAKFPGCTSSRQCPTGDHLGQESDCGEYDSDSTVSSLGTSYVDPYRPITQQHNMTGDEWDLEEEHMGSIEERLYTLFLSKCDFVLPEDEVTNASELFNSENRECEATKKEGEATTDVQAEISEVGIISGQKLDENCSPIYSLSFAIHPLQQPTGSLHSLESTEEDNVSYSSCTSNSTSSIRSTVSFTSDSYNDISSVSNTCSTYSSLSNACSIISSTASSNSYSNISSASNDTCSTISSTSHACNTISDTCSTVTSASDAYSTTTSISSTYSNTLSDIYSNTTPLSDIYSNTTPLSDIYSSTTPLSDIYKNTTPLSVIYSNATTHIDVSDDEWGLEEIIESKKEPKVVDSYLTHSEFEENCLLGWIRYPVSWIRSIISRKWNITSTEGSLRRSL